MRAGNVRHGEAGDGGVEIEEGFVSHDRGYLGAEAAGLEILVDDEAAAGAADGVQNHLAVPRQQGAVVDDVWRNALRRDLAARHHRAPEIGRAHDRTTGTNAQAVCRSPPEKRTMICVNIRNPAHNDTLMNTTNRLA